MKMDLNTTNTKEPETLKVELSESESLEFGKFIDEFEKVITLDDLFNIKAEEAWHKKKPGYAGFLFVCTHEHFL